jgi:hypothetical protein
MILNRSIHGRRKEKKARARRAGLANRPTLAVDHDTATGSAVQHEGRSVDPMNGDGTVGRVSSKNQFEYPPQSGKRPQNCDNPKPTDENNIRGDGIGVARA